MFNKRCKDYNKKKNQTRNATSFSAKTSVGFDSGTVRGCRKSWTSV